MLSLLISECLLHFRLSPRSLAAVGTFMGTGAVAAYTSRNTTLLSFLDSSTFAHQILDTPQYLYLSGGLWAAYNAYFWTMKNKLVLPKFNLHFFAENFAYFISAVLFGIGLGISGMCDPNRVIRFLDFAGRDGWDPSLMGVMGGGVLVNLVSNWVLHRAGLDAPLSTKKLKHSDVLKMGTHESNMVIDRDLLFGSALFGAGWGLGGICPGPGLVSWAAFLPNALYFVPAMMTGIAIRHQLFEMDSSLCTKSAAKKK